jgi:serine/threonine-protein kinase
MAPGPTGAYIATDDELRRWDAPGVVKFRKKLAPFFVVGGAVIVLAVLGIINLTGMLGIYAVYLAYQYAKLWSDGNDWHDVFRQPRDRMFLDVLGELTDEVQAYWNKQKRAEVRERHRQRLDSPGLFTPTTPVGGRPAQIQAAESAALASGQHAAVARQAISDRNEILRQVESLSKGDRSRIPGVVEAAQKLSDNVVGIVGSLAELDRAADAQPAASINKEITLLESQANPLDHRASEERVRRLAFLKRQRRTVADLLRRRDELKGKLDSCALALQNMRFDLLRFKAGGQTWQHVTSVAEQAAALAREVDSAVYVADELARIVPRGGAQRDGRAAPGAT